MFGADSITCDWQSSKSSTLILQTAASLPPPSFYWKKPFMREKIFRFINKIINKILTKHRIPAPNVSVSSVPLW